MSQDKVVSESFLQIALRRFFRHKLAVLGLIILNIFILSTIFAPYLTPHTLTRQNLQNRFAPPTFSRVDVAGVIATKNVIITGSTAGVLSARDAMFNLPAWYLDTGMELAVPPVSTDNLLAIACMDGHIQAYDTSNGTLQWSRSLETEITNIWAAGSGFAALTDDGYLHHLGEDGQLLQSTLLDNREDLLLLTGHVFEPLVIYADGSILHMKTNRKETIFPDEAPELSRSYMHGEDLFLIGGEKVYRYNVPAGKLDVALEKTPDIRIQHMHIYRNYILFALEGMRLETYNLEDGNNIWNETLRGEIVSLDSLPQKIVVVTDEGRLKEMNPETGGITASRRVEGYSDVHILGTDELGRDVFSRILAGGRVSLALGFIVSLTTITFGSFIGAMSGYYGSIIDTIVMRVVDFMLSIPTLPLLMLSAAFLGPGFSTMVIVLTIFSWMNIARVVRSQVLSLKEQDFVQACRALGAKNPYIVFRHIIPNTFAPIIVAATLAVGNAIMAEAQLSFLGLGIMPPTPSWGNMLMNARQYLTTAPWLAIWPGLCIFLTLLSINFIGDGLRDALDPKLTRQ